MTLTFREGRPFQVIKAGATPRARELIQAEIRCLKNLPSDLQGRPQGLQEIQEELGFALDFAEGKSPACAGEDASIGRLLSTWLEPRRLIRLSEASCGRRLRDAEIPADLLQRIEDGFGDRQFASAIVHGDFAPWNIRASGGKWTVLDWERGELQGMPGWDWLHYVIQSAILVQRLSPVAALAHVRTVFESAPFGDYAAIARIGGLERSILLAYLAHSAFVLKQTEGLPSIEEMINLV